MINKSGIIATWMLLLGCYSLVWSCSSQHPGSGQLDALPGFASGDLLPATTIAEIDAQPLPEGVEAGVWAELKAELKRVLAECGIARTTSQPPTGSRNCVTDLVVTGDAGSGYTLQWSYANVGDYNQDGLVNVSDITPVGQRWNARIGDPDWAAARMADGSADGMVTVSDITQIGQNWQSFLTAYRLYSSTDEADYPADHTAANGPGTVDLGEIPRAASTAGTGGWKVFSTEIPAHVAGTVYWVRPLDGGGTVGSPSNMGVVRSLVLSIDPVGANQPVTGAGSQGNPYVVMADADYQLQLLFDPDGDVTAAQSTSYIVSGTLQAVVSATGQMSVAPLSSTDFNVHATYNATASNTLYFIPFPGENRPPVAGIIAEPSTGAPPLMVNFDASGSADPDGGIVKYEWDWDGTGSGPWDADTGATATASHEYATAGAYSAWVRVTDDQGATATAVAVVNVSTDGNLPPAAEISADPSAGAPPLTVSFDASGSTDPDGMIVKYEWDWDSADAGPWDEDTGAAATVSHEYATAGVYTAWVRVTDDHGAIDMASAVVNVSAAANLPPTAEITAGPSTGAAPLGVSFDATGSTDPDGSIVKYEWDWNGAGAGPWDQNTGATPTTSHEYPMAGTYTAWVRVTDDGGVTDTASTEVIVSEPEIQGTLKWFFRTTGTGFDIKEAVVGTDGTVYVGAGPELHAFNPDGSVKWRSAESVWPHTRPALATDGTTYFGSAENRLYALNSDGTTKWSIATVNIVSCPPVIGADGTIYALLDGILTALNPDGSEKWSSGEYFHNGLAVGADGDIYVVRSYPDTSVLAFNPDGTEQWSCKVSWLIDSIPAIGPDGAVYVGLQQYVPTGNRLVAINPDGTIRWYFYAGGGVASSPSFGIDGTIYAGCDNGKLFAINPDGTEKWSFLTGGVIYASPVLDANGTICVGSCDRKLYAINPDGTERWSFLTNSLVYNTAALSADGSIYVASYDGSFYAVNPDGAEQWTYDPGGEIYSRPVAGADGTIYFGSLDDKLYALNPDGTEQWAYATGDDVISSPVIGPDGTIYVGSNDDELHAIKPDGTQRWFFATGGDVMSSPMIGPDGTVYVGSHDNNLYAINPDGTERWSFTTNGQVISSPVINGDGTIYVGSLNGMFYALNPNGTEKWSFSTIWSINSSPAIGADGTVYFGCDDRKFYALHPNGTEKWSFYTGAYVLSSPAIGVDGTVYVGSLNNKLYAFNPDGTVQWSFEAGGSVRSSPALGADGTIYVGSGTPNKKLYAINPNGTLQWSFTTGKYVNSSPMIGADGTIYIGGMDGKLYALEPGT